MGEGNSDHSRAADSETTDADHAASPEAADERDNELAKDLPGLPLQLRGWCRVTEQGFDMVPRSWRREAHVPWRNVTDIRTRGLEEGLVALETRRPDECETTLVRIPADDRETATLRSAWREYVLRRIERDGVLRGDYSVERGSWRLDVLALAAVSLPCGFLAVVIAAATLAGGVASVGEAVTGALNVALWLCLGLTPAVIVWLSRRCEHEARLHWYRWELGRDALVHWPFDGERRLSLGPGDTVTRSEAWTCGSLVPLRYLTHRGVVAPILLAAGERRGARVRPSPWPQWLALAVVASVISAAVYSAAAFWFTREAGLGLAAFGLSMVGAAMAIGHVTSLREYRKMLAEGRKMLDRLGW